MTKNESAADRWIRVILGLAILYLAWKDLAGWGMWVGYLVGLILLVTGLAGYCWLYQVFGMSTKKQNQ